MNEIYIDADACPVKDETYKVAERHGVKVYVVSNGGIRPNPNPLIETVIVAQGADAADMWIADRVCPGDICVTGDIPLAAKVLEAGAAAIRHNGDLFTTQNIGQQLGMRDLMADIRSANPLGASGGGRPFSKADRSRFLNSLEQVVRKVKKA
jgi:uncharacterized protein YaiI (UPF0178 family)